MSFLRSSRRARAAGLGAAAAVALTATGVLALPAQAAQPVAGSTFTLRPAVSSLCLEVPSGNTSNGVGLVQATCANGASRQQWTLASSGAGFQLKNVASGTCIDVPGSKTTSGLQLNLWACGSGKANQQFAFSLYGSTGNYAVKNAASALCLTDQNGLTTSGNPIVQHGCSNDSSQLMSLTLVGSGSPSPSPASPSPATGVTSANWFVATSGSDGNAGTSAMPFATLAKALSVVKAGQTVALRGGTYRPTAGMKLLTSGTSGARITISNYGSEAVVLDGSQVPAAQWFLDVQASFITVQGLEIRNARTKPLIFTSSTGSIVRRMKIHDNQDTGLNFRGDNTVNNQVLDNDLYYNHDDATKGQNADGMAWKFGSGSGNLMKGNRLFGNADDGLDLWMFTSPITIASNWAYGNGVNRWNISGWEGNGNGFKLGGGNPAPAVAHVVKNNASWDNLSNGFTENSNPGALVLSNNTAFRNTASGYFFRDSKAMLRKNIAISNGSNANVGSSASASDNSWNVTGWGISVFSSTSPTVAQGARKADGTLPSTTFLVNTKDTSLGATMTE
ncbi:MAG TPA: RICIN domain-containing protein [Kineosporiaceae bacterium]|nr:RICIN domain-containing protein [Kineosporiaceae bacterium]